MRAAHVALGTPLAALEAVFCEPARGEFLPDLQLREAYDKLERLLFDELRRTLPADATGRDEGTRAWE